MATELDVLRIVSDRLLKHGVEFMLTGSFALAFYETPRMTRDIDFVVELTSHNIDAFVEVFEVDFYVDSVSAREAIKSERMFNLMHLESGIKVDFITRKSSEYRRVEFGRRQPIVLDGISTWIVSREDLALSKLVWGQESNSELQRRDVRQLLSGPIDLDYIRHWATRLDVVRALNELLP